MAEETRYVNRAPGTEAVGTVSSEVVEVELARGMGLFDALAIGAGTMTGAGIFVLLGLIISRTGPAVGTVAPASSV